MENEKNFNIESDELTEETNNSQPQSADAPVDSEAQAEPAAEEAKAEKKKKPAKKHKAKKAKPIRNQAFLKRGSYSLAITAIVIAGIIVLNVLVGALAKRFNLEFDMSSDKTNSISRENIDFIKSVKDEVNIVMCADSDSYVGGYMSYYAQQYNVTGDATDYYKQTIKLIDKYDDYNSKLKVKYIDTQSTEFTEIASKYANTTLNYGDILVSASIDGNERFKKIGYTDIYRLTEDEQYAMYGYTVSTVTGNNIETALTSAISYVISDEDKKIAVLTGHSSKDYTADYISLLEQNNYEVDVISNNVITEIPKDYDAVVIAAPTKDFLSEEIIALTEFLSNGEKLDKGLIYFADASAPHLKNFSDFLTEWGIGVEEGILFETDDNYHLPDENTNIFSVNTNKDDITSDLNFCVSAYNAPLSVLFEQKHDITVTPLVATSESVVAAPKGISEDWKDFDKYTPNSYPTVIQSEQFEYDNDNDNKEIRSFVIAFSSIEFINSQYLEYSDVSNKDITLAAAERAARAEDGGISFTSKTITNESFADKVTESSTKVIRLIFVIVIPLIIIAAGIYVYIRRRNA